MTKEPLFLRFMNRELGAADLLNIFSRSGDKATKEAAEAALAIPPDLDGFRKELSDAVDDIVVKGAGEEFRAFANHHMACLVEDVESRDGTFGENVDRTARVGDPTGPWVQGFVCYNLCLYLRVFGTECLKKCTICGKVFANKGKFAVYCSDPCKAKGKKISNAKEFVKKDKPSSFPSLMQP